MCLLKVTVSFLTAPTVPNWFSSVVLKQRKHADTCMLCFVCKVKCSKCRNSRIKVSLCVTRKIISLNIWPLSLNIWPCTTFFLQDFHLVDWFKYYSVELSKSYLQWIIFVWMYLVKLKAFSILVFWNMTHNSIKVIKSSFLNAGWALYWRYIDCCCCKLYKKRQLIGQPLKIYFD